MRRVKVLYEDRREFKAKSFGLHELVKQCVCDDLKLDFWSISEDELDGVPKGGANKVHDECKRNMRRLAARGAMVFAVYDADKVRNVIGLKSIPCRRAIIEQLKKG